MSCGASTPVGPASASGTIVPLTLCTPPLITRILRPVVVVTDIVEGSILSARTPDGCMSARSENGLMSQRSLNGLFSARSVNRTSPPDCHSPSVAFSPILLIVHNYQQLINNKFN